MRRVICFLLALDWVAISSLVVAIAAFVVARKTMKDAEEDWKQRKWFDLYFKADEAYNELDYYRTAYSGQPIPKTPEQASDWNKLMFLIRQAHSMATVFPKTEAIDKLFAATDFGDPAGAFDPGRLKTFMDAVEALRQKALIKPSILN
jgi:hypothetical protein